MGLFSRTKKIKVPIPTSDDFLKFPKLPQTGKITEPEKIKSAVGLDSPPQPKEPEEKLLPPPPLPPKPSQFTPLPKPSLPPQPTNLTIQKPFFLRIQHYQHLLTNLGGIKNNLTQMGHASEQLSKSEFNENQKYEQLKNHLKKIHDRLLSMDDLIFKK